MRQICAILIATYIIDGQRCITTNFFSKVQLVLFLRMTSRRVTLNWYLTVFCVMHHWPSTFCNTQRGEIFACFTNYCANFLCEEDIVFENLSKNLIFQLWPSKLRWFSNSRHLNFAPKIKIRIPSSVKNSNCNLVIFGGEINMRAFERILNTVWIINQLLFIARESFFFFCGEGEGVATVGNWFSRWLSFNCDYFLITT